MHSTAALAVYHHIAVDDQDRQDLADNKITVEMEDFEVQRSDELVLGRMSTAEPNQFFFQNLSWC